VLLKGGVPRIVAKGDQETAGVSGVASDSLSDNNPDIIQALRTLREMNATLELASQQEPSPVEALNVVTREYLGYALRFPRRYRLRTLRKPDVGSEEQELEPEFRRTLQIVAGLIRAAQDKGEFKDGNPAQTAARIMGAIHGLADFLVSGSRHTERESSFAQRSLPRLLNLFAENAAPQSLSHVRQA
jgi:hypothetical protein